MASASFDSADAAAMNAFTVEALGIGPEDRVLEIGFGPGEALAECVRLTPGGFVAGIDRSAEMLRMAEDRNRRAVMQEHLELTLGDADALPYEDAGFDKVFAVNVLHFWQTPEQALAECLRVLKPGGLAAFSVTHPDSWPPGLAETGVLIAREPQEIQALLTRAGFSGVETRWLTQEGGTGFLVLGRKQGD